MSTADTSKKHFMNVVNLFYVFKVKFYLKLGVIFDQFLSFDDFISSVCKSTVYTLSFEKHW